MKSWCTVVFCIGGSSKIIKAMSEMYALIDAIFDLVFFFMYSHVSLVNQIQLDGIFMEVESQSLIKFHNNLKCIFHRVEIITNVHSQPR